MSSEGERRDEPKCSLFTKCNPNIQTDSKQRQTWHGINGLDSPMVTTLIHDPEQENDMATYNKQSGSHDMNKPMKNKTHD